MVIFFGIKPPFQSTFGLELLPENQFARIGKWHFERSLCPENARDLGLFSKILAFRYAANSMKCGFGGCECAIGTVVAVLFANLHILR
jgi:hypothetical protein